MKMIKRIETKDGETILVRPFSLRDFGRLQRMNPSMSAETRRDYRAPLGSPRPPITQMRHLIIWGLVHIKLAASCIGSLRQFMAFIPRMAYMAFVAVNSSDEIVGFIFRNIVGRRAKHGYIAESGIVIRDDYQGRGIGLGFSTATLELAEDEFVLLYVEIYDWNRRAILFAEKQGYRRVGTCENEDGEGVLLYVRGRGAKMTQPQKDRSSVESSSDGHRDRHRDASEG